MPKRKSTRPKAKPKVTSVADKQRLLESMGRLLDLLRQLSERSKAKQKIGKQPPCASRCKPKRCRGKAEE